ncbi:hypothetical protein SynMITS9220_02261 [Synechococcus sp. MIT S9220]|nr:hypothetical protein SynMITS9220_02261 [Synechococcus sp. MIT S9220]
MQLRLFCQPSFLDASDSVWMEIPTLAGFKQQTRKRAQPLNTRRCQ